MFFFFKSLLADVAFITNQESNMLDVIDLKSKKKVKEIKVGKKPAGIAIDKINKIIFVSNPEGNNISKVDLKKNTHEFFFCWKQSNELKLLLFKQILICN